MIGDKFRFRFRKTGNLRLLSHLDLGRCLERMLRRAAIPFKMTAGFHPYPRMVFAQSLPLGVEGHREVLELETTVPLDSDLVREQLNRQAPNGLEFTEVRVVPMKASAVPRRMTYSIPMPAERGGTVAIRAAELLAMEKVWVDRLKPKPRKLNIRPYLHKIEIAECGMQNAEPEKPASALRTPHSALRISLWVTQTGTARADELLKLLDLSDLPDAGFVLARAELDLRDETPPGQLDAPPDGPPDTAPLEYTPAPAGDDGPAEPTWGLSPNGPVVE